MKKKNGRPPLDDIQRREYQVKATLNRQEAIVLRMKLEQSRLNTADFLRELIICGEIKAPIPPEYRKMINNLYKLGQNDDEHYYFHLDSFNAMQAIAQFLCDRLQESMKLIESGKLKYGDNIVDNDEIVKLLLNMPQGDAKHRS